jgi:hypothetical protein
MPFFTINSTLQIPLYVLAFIVFTLILAVTTLIIVNRQLSLFKAASVPFCLFMLFFAGLLSLSSMLYATQPDGSDISARFVCYGRPWFSATCLTGLLAALLIKGRRIDQLFNAKKLQIKVGSNWQMAATVGAIVAMQVVMLIGLSAAQLTEPQLVVGKKTTSGQQVYQCSSIESDSFIAWVSVEIAFFAIMLIYGIRLAFRLRNVPSSFNESQQISHSIACLAFFLIILVPLQFIVQDDPNALIVIRGYGQALGAFLLCLVNFGPKVYLYFTARDLRYKSNVSGDHGTNLSTGSNGSGFHEHRTKSSRGQNNNNHKATRNNSTSSVGPLNMGMEMNKNHRSSISAIASSSPISETTTVVRDINNQLKQQHDRILEIIRQRVTMNNGYMDPIHMQHEYESMLAILSTPPTGTGTSIPETGVAVSPASVELTVV